jgi:hypothetical protein
MHPDSVSLIASDPDFDVLSRRAVANRPERQTPPASSTRRTRCERDDAASFVDVVGVAIMANQAGVASSRYRPGPFSITKERNVAQFIYRYLGELGGNDRSISRRPGRGKSRTAS